MVFGNLRDCRGVPGHSVRIGVTHPLRGAFFVPFLPDGAVNTGQIAESEEKKNEEKVF